MSGAIQTLSRGQFLLSPLLLAAAPPARIAFVCGDHEYSGEATLPLFGQELAKRYGFRFDVIKSEPDQNAETNIPGLERLAEADLAVFYLRWRRLPREQLNHIESYLKSAKPVLGLRTSSHAFNYPKGDPLESWNGWASEVFGAPPGWNVDGHRHYGHQATTAVSLNAAQAKHPILAGVNAPFTAPSWLYHVLPKYPPSKAEVLLYGDAINPNRPAERNPVAWTWINNYGARSFYTSLGHPGDFALEPFQRLLTNAIHWGLSKKIPKKWAGPMAIQVPYRGMVKS
jgi:type 1 glutamine amidotransferase